MYAGGAVDPRRHAVGRHAGARGRRAPVDHHAVGRPRAAALHRLGAGLRPGPRVDAARRARRGSAARTATSAYFRLSTRPIDQALAAVPDDAERTRAAAPATRSPAATGCAQAPSAPAVTLVGMGVTVPEALAAADELAAAGIAADVVCLTSADLIFRALQARQGLGDGDDAILDELFPAERAAPIVTVLDGHPHTLALPRRRSRRRRSPASASTTSASRATSATSTATSASTPSTIVGAALDLIRIEQPMTPTDRVRCRSLSDSMEEGTILRWLDRRRRPRSPRARTWSRSRPTRRTMTYQAEAAGTLEIVSPEGETVAVGEPIARVGDAPSRGAARPWRRQRRRPTGARARRPRRRPARPASGGTAARRRRWPAGSRAPRGRAGAVAGSGPRGRITKADVLARRRYRGPGRRRRPRPPAPPPSAGLTVAVRAAAGGRGRRRVERRADAPAAG